MATIMNYTVPVSNLTLSRIVWLALRRQPIGLVRRILRENPGIEQNIFVPVGTVVRIPIDDLADENTEDVIRLWD